jgi:hypothetical protein
MKLREEPELPKLARLRRHVAKPTSHGEPMKEFFSKAKEFIIEATCLILLVITAYQLVVSKLH